MADEVSVEAVEEALALAASSMHEQLTALDEAISYHVNRAAELRETRKRVARVEAIVNAPPDGRRNNGGKSAPMAAAARAAIGAATKRRHAEERAAKKGRVHEYLLGLPAGREVTVPEVVEACTDPTAPKNHPGRLGPALARELLRELRDEGIVRLDRQGAGGQAIYRRVGQR